MVRPGLINLDFADVETVMSSMGKAMMGTGQAEGEDRAIKAAESAINNPLIDDYSLKGAKGLLVNITGGKDLKLFEVDEAVNKVRAEVDPEAELIIGAITDPALEGIMRVSIVATALDGQQPESKSVINMVHRIQNRNPGYSDFSNVNNSSGFNLSASMANTMTSGANALKLENEVLTEEETSSSDLVDAHVLNSEDTNINPNIENHEEKISAPLSEEVNEQSSNGLENFGIEEETPDLFNSNEESSVREITSLENEEDQEDDFEIPAFLRRQKN